MEQTQTQGKKPIDLWHDRISVAKRKRDQVAGEEKWETYINEYYNKYGVTLNNMPAPAIGEVYAYVQSSVAGMYFRDPYITVNPKKKASVMGAYILEQAVNYFWRELKIKDEIELEIVDAILVGHGWHKDGLNVECEEHEGSITLKGEQLYSNRVSWKDILFNIASKRPPIDCEWMAHRLVKPVQDVRDKYKVPDLKGGPYPDLDKKTYEDSKFKDDIEFVTLWEIWDKRNRKRYLLAEGYTEKFLDEKNWPEHLDKFPFSMLWFNCAPDKAYPMSDIAPWNDQILEKIKVTAQLLNHVKRWNRQMILKEGVLTEEEEQKFKQGIDGAIIKSVQAPDANVKFADFGQFNPDVFQIIKVIDSIARVVNGNPEVDKGGVTQTPTRTLGELELIKEGARSRIDKKVDRLETHIENIARQLIANMQANFDTDQIVKITGVPPDAFLDAFGDRYDPNTNEIVFTKDDIQGEYDIDVKAGSTLPLDKQNRMRVFEVVLQTIAPNLQIVGTSPLGRALVSGLLHDFELPQLEEAFDKELQNAEAAAAQQNATAQLDAAKTAAEAQKREAQATKENIEAEMLQQEMVSPARIRELVEGPKEKEGKSGKSGSKPSGSASK